MSLPSQELAGVTEPRRNAAQAGRTLVEAGEVVRGLVDVSGGAKALASPALGIAKLPVDEAKLVRDGAVTQRLTDHALKGALTIAAPLCEAHRRAGVTRNARIKPALVHQVADDRRGL